MRNLLVAFENDHDSLELDRMKAAFSDLEVSVLYLRDKESWGEQIDSILLECIHCPLELSFFGNSVAAGFATLYGGKYKN